MRPAESSDWVRPTFDADTFDADTFDADTFDAIVCIQLEG
jgi:hypothetical protein